MEPKAPLTCGEEAPTAKSELLHSGPEYLSSAITEWANAKQIKLVYIQPGQS